MLLRTVNTAPRRRRGCRIEPVLTCSKPHRNCGRARAETTATFILTFLPQDHENLRMSSPEHARNERDFKKSPLIGYWQMDFNSVKMPLPHPRQLLSSTTSSGKGTSTGYAVGSFWTCQLLVSSDVTDSFLETVISLFSWCNINFFRPDSSSCQWIYSLSCRTTQMFLAANFYLFS